MNEKAGSLGHKAWRHYHPRKGYPPAGVKSTTLWTASIRFFRLDATKGRTAQAVNVESCLAWLDPGTGLTSARRKLGARTYPMLPCPGREDKWVFDWDG